MLQEEEEEEADTEEMIERNKRIIHLFENVLILSHEFL